MKKLVFFIVLLFSLNISATIYPVQWVGNWCPDIYCCIGDTIEFTNCMYGGMPMHEQLFMDTTLIYDSIVNNSQPLIYSYIVKGNSSYSLICNDSACQGKITVQCGNSIQSVISNFDFALFPSPSHNYVTVKTVGIAKEITITDVFGKEINTIISFSTSTIQNIEISNLPNGIYFITVTSGNQSTTQKLIVQH